ncbi:MAG: SRPBCC domain-containing protein [Pyrinomonadaceae bacterium]|nr:SRPBCC domain-containing protein [Pyrinomonadaceae bacterium]
MEKLTYSVEISANPERVWQILWTDETYRKWTKPFHETSYAESDWNEGSEILFLTEGGDGMYSVIEKKIPNEYISYKHVGMLKNGEKTPFDKDGADWTGGVESYRLEKENGKTLLTAETDSVEEYKDFFAEKFPQALGLVKSLAEESD